MNYNVKTAIEQVERNEYENEGGNIKNNTAWRWIKEHLEHFYADPSILVEHIERDLKIHGRTDAANIVALIDIIKLSHSGARTIVVEEWYRAVGEFNLLRGSPTEKLTARILDRLIPMNADDIRTKIARKIWEYNEAPDAFGDFDKAEQQSPMAALIKQTCIDQAELIRKELSR